MVTAVYRSVGTKATYSTGTVSIDGTGLIITLSGGTWDTAKGGWGAGDRITIDSESGGRFVKSLDSATQITLDAATAKTGSGKSYTIARVFNTLAGVGSIAYDLVSADQQLNICCYSEYDMQGSGFAFRCDANNWKCDSTRYVHVYAPALERHTGKEGTGVRSTSGDWNITGVSGSYNLDYFKLSWIEITGGIISASSANYHDYNHLIIHDYVGTALAVNDPNPGTKVHNNLSYNTQRGLKIEGYSGTAAYVYNNTFCNNTVYGMSFFYANANILMKNNIFVGNAQNYYCNSGDTTAEKNAGETTNTVPGQVVTCPMSSLFTDYANDDYSLLSTAPAIDAGTTLGSPYDIDLKGVTASGTWDLGAFWYVVSGVTITFTKKALQVADVAFVTNAKNKLTQTKKSVAVTSKTIAPNAKVKLTQTKKALAVAGKTVISNAKSKLTQTKKAIAVSSKTITVNAKSRLTQTKKALTVAGKTLAVNTKTQLSQTKKAIAVTGKTFTPNAKQWLTQTKKAIAVSQKTFVVNAKTLLTQTKKAIAANGKVFVTNAKTKLTQTKKSIAVAGKSMIVGGAENIAVVKRACQVTSKTFVINAKVRLTQTKKALAVTGKDITTKANAVLQFTKKAVLATGKTFSNNAAQNLTQTKKAITVGMLAVTPLLRQRLTQTVKAIVATGKAFNTKASTVIQNTAKRIEVSGKAVHLAGLVEFTTNVGGMIKAGIANRRLVTSNTYKGWLAIGSHKGGARQVIDAVPPAPHFQNKNWTVVQAHLDADNGDYTSI